MRQKGSSVFITASADGGLFPPLQLQALREMLAQAPPLVNAQAPPPARWSLAAVKAVVTWLTGYSLSGVWRILQALRLRYKRGRLALHSPDPDYLSKQARAAACVAAARAAPGQVVTLYLDELSYYRQPSLASDWAACGSACQPLARLAHGSNTRGRVVATLDALTGRVLYLHGSKIGVLQLQKFYAQIRAAYPAAETIYVIQDNWPVHFHAAVLAAAQQAGVELVALPTYAPWLNPIEKLWRWLKQQVIHQHRYSTEWATLQAQVKAFLERFATPSTALLRYCGLAV